MNFKLFTDLINALGKVTGGLKAIANLPKSERAKYRQVMDDTYRLIDTALNMVIIRLCDLQASDNDSDYIQEVAKLDNDSDWMQVEREFRLCKSLRTAVREAETLFGNLAGALSANDWNALLEMMHNVLATEGDVAFFITKQFHELADSARTASPEINEIKKNIKAFRSALISERQELIRQEIELFSLV